MRLPACFAILFLLGVPSIVTNAAEPLASSRPNIILIITDDQGYGPIGRHGHPWIETPHRQAPAANNLMS